MPGKKKKPPTFKKTKKKKTVMIIEDEKDLLLLIEKKLNKEGFVTITANDGEEGLEKVRLHKPDIVLLDIVIPKKNGYQVLEAIHKDPSLSSIPVIIISNSDPDEEKIYSLGAKDYLIKADLTPEDIQQKISRHLDNSSKQQEEKTKNKATANKHPKILLIEDDEVLRDLCLTKLQKENFEVSSAIDGQEGLRKIAQERPDLVLLDIILPGIDGFEVLKQMRNSTASIANIPVILLTNLGQETDIEKGESLGARDYLVKANFTTEEIVAKIKKALKGEPKPQKTTAKKE